MELNVYHEKNNLNMFKFKAHTFFFLRPSIASLKNSLNMKVCDLIVWGYQQFFFPSVVNMN